MTVVLLAVTPDHLVMVSDMLLTRESPGGVTTETETAAKTIIWNGHFLVGYTGWACSLPSSGTSDPIDNRTDYWIGSALGAQDGLAEGVKALGLTALDRVGSVPTGHRVLEIIGAGWVHRDGIEGLVPYTFVVSNRHPDPSQQVYPGFRISLTRVRATPALVAVGQPVDRKRVERAIRRHTRHGVGAEPFVRDLANEIRTVAARNPRVGSNMLIASLPRLTVPAPMSFSFGPPDWGRAEFRYAPGDPSDSRLRRPVVAGGGIAMGGAITVTSNDPSHVPYHLPDVDYECPP